MPTEDLLDDGLDEGEGLAVSICGETICPYLSRLVLPDRDLMKGESVIVSGCQQCA